MKRRPPVKAHFVHFLSPGTFFAECTSRPIAKWDVQVAVKLSRFVKERYNAKPYGFYFTTRTRGPKDLDSKEKARSGTYYISGKILTLAQVKAMKDPKNDILIRNMEGNRWDRIVMSSAGGWRWTQPLHKNDVVIEEEV